MTFYYTDVGNKYLKPEYTVQIRRRDCLSEKLETKIFPIAGNTGPTDTIISLPIKSSLTRPDVNSAGPCSIWAVWKYEVAMYPSTDGLATRESRNGAARQLYLPKSTGFYQPQKKILRRPDTLHTATQRLDAAFLWGTWKRWNLNYSFIYTGRKITAICREHAPVNYLQPWYTSDIALSHTFSIKKVGFKAACEVSNLFNQHYDVIVNYPKCPERTLKSL